MLEGHSAAVLACVQEKKDYLIDAVLERVVAIRESCGKYFGIAIDFMAEYISLWQKFQQRNSKNLTRCL